MTIPAGPAMPQTTAAEYLGPYHDDGDMGLFPVAPAMPPAAMEAVHEG